MPSIRAENSHSPMEIPYSKSREFNGLQQGALTGGSGNRIAWSRDWGGGLFLVVEFSLEQGERIAIALSENLLGEQEGLVGISLQEPCIRLHLFHVANDTRLHRLY